MLSSKTLLLSQVLDHVLGSVAVLSCNLVLDEVGQRSSGVDTEHGRHSAAGSILASLDFRVGQCGVTEHVLSDEGGVSLL